MSGAAAKIAVDKTVYSFDKLFTYLIPDSLLHCVKPGVRVVVPFGRGNKKTQGIVFEIFACEENIGLKYIESAIDSEPILNSDLLSVAKYMVANTFCTYYDAVHTILPNGYNYRIVPGYSLAVPFDEIDFSSLSVSEKQIVMFLKNTHKADKINAFFESQNSAEFADAVNKLIQSGMITKTSSALRRISDKTIKMVRIPEDSVEPAEKLTAKQNAVLSLIAQAGTASVKEICTFCSVTKVVLNNLEKKGYIEYYDREVMRIPGKSTGRKRESEIVLNPEQQKAFDGIYALYGQNKPNAALLHGITGSGKTSVFLKLIGAVIQSGRQVIMLVPEISLTPQTLDSFRRAFGKDVAVLHSSLSMGEQLDEWKRIKSGAVKIAVGTRSAVFSPFDNIGMIIMDEEGEFSYKSDKTPRYHAREIAKLRCKNNNALLLLASATPLIDSFYNAKTGKYSLFTLKNRYNNSVLPAVEIVDLKKEPSRGEHAVSERLLEELNVNLKNKEQSVLLLNRRGYNTHAQCVECSAAIVCPNCSVAMTYHKVSGMLVCHYCGLTKPLPDKCPNCHGRYLRLSGVGTQKLEEELSDVFPSARILRMDTDTTYSKFAFEEKLGGFRDGKYDIMLGTQMIAKGHDFPNVTLTGVILADQTLYSGDFRCGEKTFSLLTQVVGRAGRAYKPGRAIIQTYSPDDPVISFAAAQNYEGFYENEIEARRAMLYPPFCDLCVFGVSGSDEGRVIKAANTLAKIIINTAKQSAFNEPLKLLGPTQANIYRINKKYRYRLIIKCRMNSSTKKFIRFVLNGISALPQFKDISVYADVNGEIN